MAAKKKRLLGQYRKVLETGHGNVGHEIMMIKVIEMTGWDYYTFLAQPWWVIDLLYEMKNLESNAIRVQNLNRKN